MRADEGDESIDEMADEAAKTNEELKETTEAGKKAQEASADSTKAH